MGSPLREHPARTLVFVVLSVAPPPVSLPLPSTLTPSKISAFTTCPLAFRLAVIERLPEPPSLPALKGTLVHRALQLLFMQAEGPDRDLSLARQTLERAATEMEGDPEVIALGLADAERDQILREAGLLIERYFELEDPRSVRPAGLELDLQVEVDGLLLRGIIDRLDVLPDGGLAVVDYKTGRAPRVDQAKSRLFGVQLYALLCETVLGRRPSVVRLLYLRDRVAVSTEPTDTSLRGVRQRAGAVWKAIERACERNDFRPNPSPLCGWCAFQSYCPAFGGNPDAPR